MPSLTFEALLRLFQAECTYQEIITHGLSDFLRAGDDIHLHAAANHLDQAAATSNQEQTDGEIRAALQVLEQATELYRTRRHDILARTIPEGPPDHVSAYYEQLGYYLASISLTVISMLSKQLGLKEQCEKSADRALGMFVSYEENVMQEHRLKHDDLYLPPSARISTEGLRNPSAYMQIKKERTALYKVLKKWLDTRTVKALILLYNRW